MITMFKSSVPTLLNEYFVTKDEGIYPKKNGYIIEFAEKSSIQRYQPNMNTSQIIEFRREIDVLFRQIIFMLKSEKYSKVYITSYDKSWFFCSESGLEYILDKKKMLCTDEQNILKSILIMSLQHEAFPVFINEELKTAIIPTDHCDLFVSSEGYSGSLYSNNCGLEIKAWMGL